MRKPNWLNDNVASILAILWTLFTFHILRMVLLKQISATENIAFLIINTVSNICMIIVGYHFGSSAGSKSKQDSLLKAAENTSSSTESTTTNTTSTKSSNEAADNDNNSK